MLRTANKVYCAWIQRIVLHHGTGVGSECAWCWFSVDFGRHPYWPYYTVLPYCDCHYISIHFPGYSDTLLSFLRLTKKRYPPKVKCSLYVRWISGRRSHSWHHKSPASTAITDTMWCWLCSQAFTTTGTFLRAQPTLADSLRCSTSYSRGCTNWPMGNHFSRPEG